MTQRATEEKGTSILVWLFITLLMVVLGVGAQKNYVENKQREELTKQVHQLTLDVHAISSHSPVMGASVLMGLISDSIKQRLDHQIPADAPRLHQEFTSMLQEYDANIAVVIDNTGVVVGYWNTNPAYSSLGLNVSFRPYWQRAMRGVASVYPALGTADELRGLYIAAPVHRSIVSHSPVIGVYTIRINADLLDEKLRTIPSPALLISPDGVVFSANRPEWILKLTAPLSPQQRARLNASRQFQNLFRNTMPALLPFQLHAKTTLFEGKDYAVSSELLDWPDEQGSWQIVVLQDMSNWLPFWQAALLTIGIIAMMGVLRWIWLLQHRMEEDTLAAVEMQQEMQRQARQHLQDLSDALPLAIFQFHQSNQPGQSRYTYASAKTREVLGLNAYELLTDPLSLERILLAEDHPAVLQTINHAIQHKLDFELDHRITRNNEVRWVRVKAICSRQEHGEWIWNGYWMDITSRHRQTEQLQEAKDAAEEATRTKSMFLANMSHEIRTPMNAVIGLAYLALKTELTPKQRDYLNKIHHAGTTLLDIINDILDFSKIEANQLQLEQTAFNLDDILANLSVMSSQRAYEKGLELLFDVPPDIPRNLIGDPLRVGQILINLVSNAVKFTDRGYVHLQIQALARQGDSITLQFMVRDTGIGMTPLQLSRLFQAFTQADGSTTRRFGGTGLGLTIARHLVEKMDGTIQADSEPNVGSQFTFTIPLLVGQPLHEQRQLIPRSITNLRILVVDDNQVASDILLAALRQLPVRPEAVNSAAVAWTQLQQAAAVGQPYDLLMTDWQMPEMDGMMLAQKVQRMPSPPRMILVTSFSYDEVQEQARAAGIEGFLTKPISQSQVVDCLMRLFAPAHGETAAALEQIALPQFRQVRVLLAEDNPINQQIAVELMVACGIHTDIAANGKEALSLLFSHEPKHYDLVFMDLQMPEMDGHEATRVIRADARFQQLPIIAMTAHALQNERERCLTEGMNDHIAKPISPELFYQLLKQYLSYKLTGVSTTTPRETTLPKLEGLNSKAALQRVNGNQVFYLQLLRQYSREQGNTAKQIETLLAQQQIDAALPLAHSLKGVSANIGADPIAMLAAQLEKALANHQPMDELNALNQTLMVALQQLCAQIDALDSNAEIGTSASAPVTDDALLTLLKKIQDNDCEALDLFAQLEPGLQQRIPVAELQQINHHLQAFDFDLALLQLERFTPAPATAAPDAQSPG